MKDRIDALIDLCVDIYAHVELDMEITLMGNGCNACECSGVADTIVYILKLEKEKVDKRVESRVKELKELYNIPDE